MKSFKVYEMVYSGETIHSDGINMLHFEEKYYPQYEKIYNECFYDMRKALAIEPYNFYSDINQIKDVYQKQNLTKNYGNILLH